MSGIKEYTEEYARHGPSVVNGQLQRENRELRTAVAALQKRNRELQQYSMKLQEQLHDANLSRRAAARTAGQLARELSECCQNPSHDHHRRSSCGTRAKELMEQLERLIAQEDILQGRKPAR